MGKITRIVPSSMKVSQLKVHLKKRKVTIPVWSKRSTLVTLLKDALRREQGGRRPSARNVNHVGGRDESSVDDDPTILERRGAIPFLGTSDADGTIRVPSALAGESTEGGGVPDRHTTIRPSRMMTTPRAPLIAPIFYQIK